MASIDDGLLEAAQKHLGYQEKSDGYTIFGEWYYANVDKSDAYFKTAPWCDMFITWAANQAGVERYVGEFAYTVDHAKWFKEQGAWSDRPEPGAIVFYDWSGSNDIGGIDHAGIVEKVDGGTIFTIEANVDKVWLKRKERGQDKVVGYGLPRKVRENKGEDEVNAPEEKPGGPVPTSKPDEPVEVVDQPGMAIKPAILKKDPTAVQQIAVPADNLLEVATIHEAAVPAATLAAVLGLAVLVNRARITRQRPTVATATGRHRRQPGRHRVAPA